MELQNAWLYADEVSRLFGPDLNDNRRKFYYPGLQYCSDYVTGKILLIAPFYCELKWDAHSLLRFLSKFLFLLSFENVCSGIFFIVWSLKRLCRMRPVAHVILQTHHFHRPQVLQEREKKLVISRYGVNCPVGTFLPNPCLYFFQGESEFVKSPVFPNLYTSIGI